MGVKGISWIEQNVEKVIVGVFGVGLLGVIAVQFVGGSTTIKLTGLESKPKEVPIDSAMSAIGDKARLVHDQLTSATPRELSDFMDAMPKSTNVQESFNQGLTSVAPSKRLAASFGDTRGRIGVPSEESAPAGMQSFMYARISPPAPEKPVGVSYLATINPIEYTGKPDVAAILPPDPLPKDKAAVSIETSFNGAELSRMMQEDPDGTGPLSALPAHWWNADNTQVLAVNLERQELQPDGTWSSPQPVAPMPGRPSLMKQMQGVATGGAEAMRPLMLEARAKAADIRRPSYYEIVFGEDWVAPVEAVALREAEAVSGPATDDKSRAERQLATKDAEIAKVQEEKQRLERDSGPAAPDSGRPPAPPPPGGKGRPNPVSPPNSPNTNDPKARRIKALEDKLERLYRERTQVIEQWRKRGVELEPEAVNPTDPAMDPNAPKAKDAPELPLLDNPAAKILAHDVTVIRGKTYRYRVSLTLNNPVYGKVVAGTPDQEALQKLPFITSAPSEWSAPVSVEAESYYFITNASSQDAVSRGSRASADVYIFRWGFWRKGSVNIEPGDMLITDVKVPDLSKQVAMLSPGGTPDMAMPPGERGRNTPVPPPSPGTPDETKAEVMYTQVPVSHDAVMLQVAPTAVLTDIESGRPRTEQHVFLRDSSGAIAVRSPEGDRVDSTYRRLAISAQHGEESLRPKIAIPAPGQDGRPLEGPRGRQPVEEPGDGGGGGGGG
ncbi:MAG: hypothetical protein AB7G11_11250 [Phycisphaerales bacterium]